MDAEFVRSEVLTPGCLRLSCLCLLMNPILPGVRSIGTRPANILNHIHTCWAELSRAAQELNLSRVPDAVSSRTGAF
jgi:hypothetical protein